MEEVKTFSGGKLVRDKVPEQIEAEGHIAVYKQTDHLTDRLKEKLLEEAEEAAEAEGNLIEELSDLIEIIAALAKTNEFTMQDLQDTTMEKVAKKGSFDKGYVLYAIKSND